MTTEQAIEILDQATALLQLNRQQHITVAQALEIIKAELSAKRQEPETRNGD